ncbi:Serine/threonine/tyrosine-protein kinase [Penicillium digitatum]|nr:Serine/threonine/tyrosine-protein kinase [Penicillium digitatum]
MWHRLGLRKLWQGRDDHRDTTSGESQDEISPRPSSDNSRAKQDNLTRRLSRKVGVGLPRTTHFNRQSSDLERLTPREPDIRRALSADRRPLSSPKSRSPPPTVGPRKSAPEVQWLGPTPTTTVDDAPEPESEPNDAHEINDISESSNPHSEITTDNFDVTEDDDYSMDLDMELEQRWILNLSMHFRDGSEREKFFVTYAETPNRWRRVTISCDYHDAQPYSLERELKELRYQRDKCARIYESIRESLLAIQFYEGVTNLRLETSDGRLHVHVTEDVNETIPYPPISCIRHLVNAPIIPEDSLHFESHLSGFVYKINMDGRFYIKKEIPGPDTVDEFLYEINALHALKDRPSVIQVEGIVVDEWRGVVKGLLITYAEKGALVDILYEQRGRTSFARRERWAKQIVQGLCEIHESGYVQGDFTLANIVVDADDNAKIIDINRRGCPVGWEPPEIAAMIESNQRISMYIGVKTDLFQLGMTLWALAMEEDEPERQPRPLRLGDDVKIPEYYRQIVAICLSPTPRHRLSAKDLLSKFPPLPEARVSTPIQSLETIANDSRHLPFSNWALPQPSELGQTFPKGMMQQDNHDYPQKEFSGNSHDEMAHPIFSESHDLVKQSTITLAELNGDMGFSSKPSSSSTLNHHESHNHYEYIEFPRHFDDGSSPYHSDSQRPEDTLVSQIRSMGNGFHSHTLEPPVFSNKSNSLETAPMNNQQETPDQPIYNDSRALVSTEITAPPLPEVSISLVESQDQEALNRPFPKPANDEVDLETSALPISPTFRDYGTSSDNQAIHFSTGPSSIKHTNQEGDQPCARATTDKCDLESSHLPLGPTFRDPASLIGLQQNAPKLVNSSPKEPPKQKCADLPCAKIEIKPKFSEPLPTSSSLSLSELPINPTFRSSGASIGALGTTSSPNSLPVQLSTQNGVDQPRTDATTYVKPTLTTPQGSKNSQPFPSSPINPTLARSGPSLELPSAPRVVESSPIEPPKQTHPSSPYANTGVKPKFTEPSPSTSTLASSELPINPTFRSSETSINISSAPSSQGPSPIETPKPDHAVMPRENDITPTSSPKSSRFPSMHISSLRHTGASIGSLGTPFAASPSVFRIGLLRRPWEKPSANYPDLKSASTMSPGSASSIGNSQTLRKPENAILPAKTHPIESQRNEPCGQSSSTMAGINHTQANLLNSNSSLLRSKLPISPAHSNSKAGSTYAEVEMARAVQGPPSSQAKPSISRFSSN